MKPYLQNLVKKISFPKLLLIAVIIRIVLVPISFHSDLNTNAIWGTYAREFGFRGYYYWLNFGNYARPEYPPFSTILFTMIKWIWQVIFNFIWFINIKITIFPSDLVTWFDNYGYRALLKFPGIISDIAIGYLIFKFTQNKKLASLYLFNPAIIYLSSLWGQTESFVAFFALLGVILFLQNKYFIGLAGLFVSFMTKASMLPILPLVVIQAIKNKIKAGDVFILTASLLVGAYIVGSLFTDHQPLNWMAKNYGQKFMTGPHNLPYINLNAFNFWGLILGLERISDKSYSLWGWAIASFFFILIIYKFWKNSNLFFASLLIFFASFLFLPRMHERYLFPVFVFFPFVLSKFPKFRKVFYLLSLVFLINLYHWWWVPNIATLVSFFDLELVERGLSLINLSSFGYLLWKYQLS